METYKKTYRTTSRLTRLVALLNQIEQPLLKYDSIVGLDLIDTSDNALTADVMLPIGAKFDGDTSNITFPDLTGLNAVGTFSVYFSGVLNADLVTKSLFTRAGTSSNWLRIGSTLGVLEVDISGNSTVTGRWKFSGIVVAGKMELLIIFNSANAKATRVQIIYNGITYNATTVPTGTAAAQTASFSGASKFGTATSTYSPDLTLSKLGVWNTVVSLAQARIAANSPLLYYADCFSAIDISGNAKHGATFTNITKGYIKNSWHLDYGYTLYSDGGVNQIKLPYNASSTPVITSETHVRNGVTYNKISEHISGSIGFDMTDFEINFNSDNLNTDLLPISRSDTAISTSTARAGYYNAAIPHTYHVSELNRETLTAFFNVPNQFNLFPKFDGNSVDGRVLFRGVYIYPQKVLTTAIVEGRLTFTGDSGKVTIPTELNGFENAVTVYTDNAYVNYKISTFTWDAARNLKVFSYKNKSVFLSEDGGVTWKYKNVIPSFIESMGALQIAYIHANGNIQFASRTQMFLASSDLSTITLKTVYEADGVTPLVPTGAGQYFYSNWLPEKPAFIDGNEVFLWTNYGNISQNTEVNIFLAENNGENIKSIYKWGINPDHLGYGDPLNANYCRHGHGITQKYNETNTFYHYTGDYDGEVKIMKCVFAEGLWTFDIIQAAGLYSSWKWGGAAWDGNDIYWLSDSAESSRMGFFKCSDIVTPGTITLIDKVSNIQLVGVIDKAANTVVATSLGVDGGLTLSTDFANFTETVLSDIAANLTEWKMKNSDGWYICKESIKNPAALDQSSSGRTILIKPK